jgi:hypothetical protein
MKKLVLFIIGVTFQISSAQIINFPDLNFKNALLDLAINYDSNGTIFPMIDLNNDDEITQAEAQLVQKLNLSYAELNDLTGLQFFINLSSFDSLFFNGSSFNFPGLINLENLTLSNAVTGQSNLVTINLSSNINLKTVSCYTNANTINLSNLTQLTNLTLYGNFTSLNINDSENLLFLNIDDNFENYVFTSKVLLSVAPPSAMKAKGRCKILLMPSLTKVVFPVPIGPSMAIAVPVL